MYVCKRIYLSVCVCLYVFFVRLNVCVCLCVCVCVWVCVCAYVCTRNFVYVWSHVCVCAILNECNKDLTVIHELPSKGDIYTSIQSQVYDCEHMSTHLNTHT